MLQQKALESCAEMAFEPRAASKRNARTYDENHAARHQLRRASTFEETADAVAKDKSISTATRQPSKSRHPSRQTSVEASPSSSVAQMDQQLDIALTVQGPKGAYPGAVEMFASLEQYTAFAKPGTQTIPSTHQPANFGTVVPGLVYRSSFPQLEDYAFVKTLKLKTVVTLVQKEFPDGYQAFLHQNGIKHHVFDMKGTKKEEIPFQTMISIVSLVLDPQNYPLLMHCNHGRHRTGCVVAVVRKVSGWDLNRILEEYREFAEPKVRDCDIDYIREFKLAQISNLSKSAVWNFRTRGSFLRATLFLRTTIFTLVVLMMWVLTGTRMVQGTETNPPQRIEHRRQQSSL